MTDKIKVAIVLHGLGANGIDTLFANLSQKWDYEKFDITYLIAVDEGAEQFWESDVRKNGVQVIHLHDLDKNRLIKWPVTLMRALKKYGPFDAVHMNMDMLNGINLLVAKKVGIPVRVCHAHRSSSTNASSKTKQAYIALMKKMIKRYATKCVACSDVAGGYFFGDMAFDLLYNGIDVDKYRFDKKLSGRGKLRFVTVGRVCQEKNPLFLIELFMEVAKRKPEAKLKWIGNGEMLDEVRHKAIELGISDKVEFMGIRNDVNEILKESDYFLLPSVFEGLSLALAEAQAAGLDCFVSDTVSRMSDCGKCMFIPLEKSASEWADIICEYIDGSTHMDIDDTRLVQFDIGEMAIKLENIYEKRMEIC